MSLKRELYNQNIANTRCITKHHVSVHYLTVKFLNTLTETQYDQVHVFLHARGFGWEYE